MKVKSAHRLVQSNTEPQGLRCRILDRVLLPPPAFRVRPDPRPADAPACPWFVDDRPPDRSLLSKRLRYEGWGRARATDGASEVSIGSQLRPAWSVLDLMAARIDRDGGASAAAPHTAPSAFCSLPPRATVRDRIAVITRGRRRLRHQAVQPREWSPVSAAWLRLAGLAPRAGLAESSFGDWRWTFTARRWFRRGAPGRAHRDPSFDCCAN